MIEGVAQLVGHVPECKESIRHTEDTDELILLTPSSLIVAVTVDRHNRVRGASTASTSGVDADACEPQNLGQGPEIDVKLNCACPLRRWLDTRFWRLCGSP